MPRYRSFRPLVIALGIALAAAVPLAATADAPITVTFQSSNPWTQELGTLKHFDTSLDYSVSVEAGKTLQINLVTRNPNIYFRVKNETTGKTLTDTFKTGATTWSTPVASAATFGIHVYVERGVIARGESAKFALQIGRYGASDMQAATTEVTFQPGNPWAQQVGKLDANATAHDYTVAATPGNTLQVNLVTRDAGVNFKVEGPDKTVLVDSASSGKHTWSAPVTTAGTWTISVYTDPASMPPGKAVGYALQIGQYPTTRAAPAAAGTAAAPAAAATAAPASS